MAKRDERAIVRRMSNLGNWEMYRVALEESDDVMCMLGVRPGESVEFALFPAGQREASNASALPFLSRDPWSDISRRAIVAKILDDHTEAMPKLAGREIGFDLGVSPEES